MVAGCGDRTEWKQDNSLCRLPVHRNVNMENPAVVLRIAKGALIGATYIFDKPSICVLGRGDSCYPRLPNDEHNKDVSRYHCLLIINPPHVIIQDLGSCNGTFVNGERLTADLFLDATVASLQRIPSGRFPLKGGDEFALGQNAVFQVAVVQGVMPPDDDSTYEKGPDTTGGEDSKCSYLVAKLVNAS